MKNLPLAVVTGGSSGIGESVCQRLINEDYFVINADVQYPERVPSQNYQYLSCDITQRDDIRKLSQSVQQKGVPEVLVLNAGLGVHERIREGDPEKWIKVININVCGSLRVLRSILPFMKAGHIIFMSSVSSSKPHPYEGIYASTKSAIDTIAETLRLEELPLIGVTVIAPGVVNTPFFNNVISGNHTIESIGWGAVEPDEIADAVVFVLRQKKGTVVNNITIRPSGQSL